jgi:hypothetical protein
MQVFRCDSCKVLLEDDREYNTKLYLIFIIVIVMLGLFIPLFYVLLLLPFFLLVLFRNMRFVEK